MGKRLFLIDGNSLINRAFYALPPLTNAAGEPTNAVYGLTRMLFRLQEDYEPDEILVAFDVSGPTFRHERYVEYKAHRKGMPDDLRPQLGLMKEVLDALGIARIEAAGFEADDLIGTAAKMGEKEGYEVTIVTGDRDALQLISPQTKVLLTKRGITDTELIDEAALLKNYELTPGQVKDMKGLMGDSSDNIPGVPGVGEKTAMRLLRDFKSMAGVYKNIAKIRGKLKERLVEYKEQAILSKELATIKVDVPISLKLGEKPVMDEEKVRRLFEKLEFKTLLQELPAGKREQEWDSSFQAVNKENFPEFLKALRAQENVFILTREGEKTLSLLTAGEVWLASPSVYKEKAAELTGILREKKICCSEGKRLQHLLQAAAEPLPVEFDLELALYCLNPEERWDLDQAGSRFKLPALPQSKKDLGFLAAGVRLLEKLFPLVEKQLQADELWELYKEVELPLSPILAKMEHAGILVDQAKLKEISQDLDKTLTGLTKAIHEEAGEEFNINSPKQLGVILFEKMGLPVLQRTKTGPSTRAEVLEKLAAYPIVNHVLEYRQVAKLKSTYADALGELISPKTGRIHTTFNQTVTATGRLSSMHPNLQNIPVRTDEGRRIREAFAAPAGSYLLSADYSQIELRILAHISRDETLIEAFKKGRDIHAQTASEVFQVPLADVSSKEREAAKAINFGIIYGISSFGLAKGINLTREEAQTYIDAYFKRYPRVKAYLDGAIKTGEELGYVTTILKRRRYLPALKSKNYAARNFAARTAMNSPIQGSAADIIKLAMLNVSEALEAKKLEAELLLQVHDELVFEVPRENLEAVAALVQKEMQGVISLSVPLLVDLSYGENWRDLAPFNLEEQHNA
ncbi:MAG TPA: DNA polymerase I [Firmicutes bacterium]|nr:DNA polymerase I [Bacillota bacterium]